MTREEFKRRYLQGLNMSIVMFEKALYTIMTTEEIDNLIKHSTRRERKFLKKFKKAYVENCKEWDCISIWHFLNINKSKLLLDDIICVMSMNDKRIYKGEDEE